MKDTHTLPLEQDVLRFDTANVDGGQQTPPGRLTSEDARPAGKTFQALAPRSLSQTSHASSFADHHGLQAFCSICLPTNFLDSQHAAPVRAAEIRYRVTRVSAANRRTTHPITAESPRGSDRGASGPPGEAGRVFQGTALLILGRPRQGCPDCLPPGGSGKTAGRRVAMCRRRAGDGRCRHGSCIARTTATHRRHPRAQTFR